MAPSPDRDSVRILFAGSGIPDEGVVAEAVAVLRGGGLVAFPTETVYGLGGRALDVPSIARIFEAKGRPSTHPLIAHVTRVSAARVLAATWSEQAERLAQAFWPGPLTLVVPRAASVPAALGGGGSTVAVRSPRHPVARALIEALGEPIAAPSANRYQHLSPTEASHVVRSLGRRVDLVLDGGPCSAGIESTVVDVTGEHPTVLRPGSLSLEALRNVVPDVRWAPLVADSQESRPSPGMDARHYAPRVPLELVQGRGALEHRVRSGVAQGARLGMVLWGKPLDGQLPEGWEVRVLPADPEDYGQRLFATLHGLEDAGVEGILVESVPDDEMWWAVRDRLARGAVQNG